MFLDKQHQDKKAFSRYTPSLFIIDTPFQLLCSIEAIKEFEIMDYFIIAAFEKSEKRNDQVIKMLEEEKLHYKIEWVEDYWGMVDDFIKKSASTSNKQDNVNCKWERVFVGNFNALDQWISAFKYADRFASIVFMDDGSSSISLLKKNCGINTAYESSFFKIFREYDLDIGPYIFTIYSDIKSKRFSIHQNKLSHLFTQRIFCNKKGDIYVIGTNSKSYSMATGLSLSVYEGVLWINLSELRSRYPNVAINYIPHGRDTDVVIENFCNLLNIRYLSIDCAVEYFFKKNGCNVNCVYGFGSTALLTVKLMMPDITVTNWFLDNPAGASYRDYLSIAKYYSKHGIIMERIPYPHSNFITRIKRCRFFRTIKNLLKKLKLCHVYILYFLMISI